MKHSHPSHRWNAFHILAIFFFLAFLPLMTACDKLPKMGDLASDDDKSKPSTEVSASDSTEVNPDPGSDSNSSLDPQDLGSQGNAIPLNLAEFLKIPSYDRKNQHLKELAASKDGLEKLTKLDLSGSSITSDGLKSLPQFTLLVELNLSQMKGLKDSDLQFVGQLPNLEVLLLESTPISDAGLAHLTSLKKLKTLNLQQTSITDAGFLHLKLLTVLESLNVSQTGINGSGFKVFYPRGLRVIEAHHTSFATEGFNHIANSKTLESLIVAEASVVDNNLRALKGCINLRKLDLAFNSVTTFGFKDLGGLRNLEYLDLWNNQGIGDPALNIIKNYKKLKVLITNGTGISQEALVKLKKDYIPELKLDQN